MKIDLVGMIFNHVGRRPFEGIIIDNAGHELDALQALDHMILEYVKVRYGGSSNTVAVPDSIQQLRPVAWWDAEAPSGLRWADGFMRNSFPDGSPVVVLSN